MAWTLSTQAQILWEEIVSKVQPAVPALRHFLSDANQLWVTGELGRLSCFDTRTSQLQFQSEPLHGDVRGTDGQHRLLLSQSTALLAFSCSGQIQEYPVEGQLIRSSDPRKLPKVLLFSLDTAIRAIDRDSGKTLWQRSEWLADDYPTSVVSTWNDDLVLMESSRNLPELVLTRLRPDGRVLARTHHDGLAPPLIGFVPTLEHVVVKETNATSTRLTSYSNTLTMVWQSTLDENTYVRAYFGHLIMLKRTSGGTRVIDARTGNGKDFSADAQLLPDGMTVLDGSGLHDFFTGSMRWLPVNIPPLAIDSTRRWLVFSRQERFQVFDFAGNRIAEYPAVSSFVHSRVFNGRMLAIDSSNGVSAIDAATGNVLWRQTDFFVPWLSQNILVEGDRLLTHSDMPFSYLGTLEAVMELDLQTGHKVWHVMNLWNFRDAPPLLIKNRIRIDSRLGTHAPFGLQARSYPLAGSPQTDVGVKFEQLPASNNRWRITVQNHGGTELPAVRLYWSEEAPGNTQLESCSSPPLCARQSLPQTLAMTANSAQSFVVSTTAGLMLAVAPGGTWSDTNIRDNLASNFRRPLNSDLELESP
jgi:outer membrane protein assembly factor BamB